MYKKILAAGVLTMAVLANAQTPIEVKPDSNNTNKLSACEVSQGFYQIMDGTRASAAITMRNAGTNAVTGAFSTTWKDTLFADTNNGVGTRAIYKTGDAATDITTRQLIADFDARIAFRNTNNSGFFYRAKTGSAPPWQTGIEVGIDNNNNAARREQTGSVFDIFPPQPLQLQTTFLYASNKWNELRVIAINDSVEHWVNGIKVAGFKFHSPTYFAGVGTVAGVPTGYNQSKWTTQYGRDMSFNVKNTDAQGFIARGAIGVQGAHPGNMIIRNFRIDTIPSWAENNAHYPDSNVRYSGTPGCGAVSSVDKAVKGTSAALRIAYSANKVSILIPGTSMLREVVLVDAFGRVRSSGRVSGRHVEFEKIHNGVYFLRYTDLSGTHNARISLIGLR